MKKNIIIFIIVALLLPLVVQAQYDTLKYTFVFNLHEQTRKYDITMLCTVDTLQVKWTTIHDMSTQKGCYKISKFAVENGNTLSWQQPQDNMNVTLNKYETFGFISLQALKDLKAKGWFVYNETTYRLLNDSTPMLLHVQADIDPTQMWIMTNKYLPVIYQMKDNPLGINWTVIEKK